MTYHFECLGDQRFQQLCQSLLVAQFPDTQCLPVGQPDGGRDGFQRTSKLTSGHGFAVYQVKFVRDSNSKTEREAVESLIESEVKKVKRLIDRGATSYYFLTNVAGTSHLDVGSIDRVNRRLSDAFGIPAHCWWRDDLARRIDQYPGIKWSFPEILKATDLIVSLLDTSQSVDMARRAAVIKAYMAYQARRDSQLKFKQVDLHKDMLDLFVDVPAAMLPTPGVSERTHLSQWMQLIHECGIRPIDESESVGSEPAVGALQLMVHERFAPKLQRLVVEGAPGQGKSTITQYLCQVNRLLLLNKPIDLNKVLPQHRPTSARVPFRVDLRDYASWLTGRNPFAEDASIGLPSEATPVLESFIAFQIHHCTGSAFSVDDLNAVSRTSQIVIVLDGFDEVADIRLRNQIVSEVSDAATRIAEAAISSQIIVTSRPAAFANSPGFPREEWAHLQLLPLTPSVIESYALKWLDGRSSDRHERRGVLSVLQEKLTHPHVRDLARNPMQLAILLTLISVQGASLPDKRTALYDGYVNIFFNRESEKSVVVRDHRDLLIQIHRYLAWLLQSEAEGSRAGNIGDARLKEVLRHYLESNKHPVDLVDKLFTGMVERVVALVSRVQGTFEFEVQPLREYFAARHLYDTAPYRLATLPSKGGKPERFEAIARNFYWLNVTRFYAGCYSSGELASLIQGIEDLRDSKQFQLIGYTAELGVTLLNDYVFSQHPKLAFKMAESIAKNINLRLLIAESYCKRGLDMFRVPVGAGTSIIDFVKQLLRDYRSNDILSAAGQILTSNCSYAERHDLWRGLNSRIEDPAKWLLTGAYLGIFREMPVEDGRSLVDELGEGAYSRFAIEDRFDVLGLFPKLWDDLVARMISGSYYIFALPDQKKGARAAEVVGRQLGLLLWPYGLQQICEDSASALSVRETLSRVVTMVDEQVNTNELIGMWPEGTPMARVYKAVEHVLDSSVKDFRADSAMWSEMLDACKMVWGDDLGLYAAAVNYAEVCTEKGCVEFHLLDEGVALCARALFAKSRSKDKAWWNGQLQLVVGAVGVDRRFAILCAARWMPLAFIITCVDELAALLDEMSASEWADFYSVASYLSAMRLSRENISLDESKLPKAMSPRLALLLADRLQDKPKQSLILSRFFEGYSGDDSSVWYAVASSAVSRAYAKSGYWPEALRIVNDAYKRGAILHFSEGLKRGGKTAIPIEIAKKICGSPDDFPVSLIGAASMALTANTGAAAASVANVATRDGWFVECDD